jgi:hypothetical protein
MEGSSSGLPQGTLQKHSVGQTEENCTKVSVG